MQRDPGIGKLPDRKLRLNKRRQTNILKCGVFYQTENRIYHMSCSLFVCLLVFVCFIFTFINRPRTLVTSLVEDIELDDAR